MAKKIRRLILAALALIIITFWAVAMGATSIPVLRVTKIVGSTIPFLNNLIEKDWSIAQEVIVLQIRLPRVLLALLVGGGLSVSGVLFQGTLRNPLADPFIIGVSSGASLGAALGLIFFIPKGIGGFGTLPVFAFVGAVAATFVVYRLGQRRGRLEPTALILAGVAMGSFLTSMVSLLMVLRIQNLHDVYLWLMGSLSGRGWNHLATAFPYLLAGLIVSFWLARDLDIYSLGDETAHSLGIDAQKLQRLVLIVGSLMAAACVAVTGVIGFVGLMTPHALRLILGAGHRRLLLYSFWVGAVFLLLADTLARTAFSPIELPVGIVTAFIGGPFFIYLLKRGSVSYE